MSINIEELKKLAQAATQGPWEFKQSSDGSGDCAILSTELADDGKPVILAETFAALRNRHECDHNTSFFNAKYIAAANPASVLELIVEYEKLRAAIKPAAHALANRDWHRLSLVERAAVKALEEAGYLFTDAPRGFTGRITDKAMVGAA